MQWKVDGIVKTSDDTGYEVTTEAFEETASKDRYGIISISYIHLISISLMYFILMSYICLLFLSLISVIVSDICYHYLLSAIFFPHINLLSPFLSPFIPFSRFFWNSEMYRIRLGWSMARKLKNCACFQENDPDGFWETRNWQRQRDSLWVYILYWTSWGHADRHYYARLSRYRFRSNYSTGLLFFIVVTHRNIDFGLQLLHYIANSDFRMNFLIFIMM